MPITLAKKVIAILKIKSLHQSSVKKQDEMSVLDADQAKADSQHYESPVLRIRDILVRLRIRISD